MKLSENGKLKLVQREDCKLTAYQDIKGIWTIGCGHTGPEVVEGLTISHAQAEAYLFADVAKCEAGITKACAGVELSQNEFDALVSFAYNIGVGGFKKSEVLQNLLKGDKQAAAEAFMNWQRVGEDKTRLRKRRESERKQFLQG